MGILLYRDAILLRKRAILEATHAILLRKHGILQRKHASQRPGSISRLKRPTPVFQR
jgi:hypothetical protein